MAHRTTDRTANRTANDTAAQQIWVDTPRMRFAALAWGPTGSTAPLALLLHGFPDTAWSWREVAPVLASAGYRVVAPFSRGYHPTGLAPDGSYQQGALIRDALDLHDALAADERALLVGHDWGAATAWGVAAHAPARFGHLVAMSLPPIPVLERELRSVRRLGLILHQLRNSWYIAYHQLPALPERTFSRTVARLWRDWSPGFDATTDLAHVAAALPSRAHRSAAIDYYRDGARARRRHPDYADEESDALRRPGRPALYLHGTRDGCLDPAFAAAADKSLPPGSRTVLVPAAGHFLQLEQPEVVAREILSFTGRLPS